MYRVSIELYKHEWKFGRTRNAVGTRAAGECFHSFFEFSQTFTKLSPKLSQLLITSNALSVVCMQDTWDFDFLCGFIANTTKETVMHVQGKNFVPRFACLPKKRNPGNELCPAVHNSVVVTQLSNITFSYLFIE